MAFNSGITVDGFDLEIILTQIKSQGTVASYPVGGLASIARSGGSEQRARAEQEKNTNHTGPMMGIYDPEFAAAISAD